MPYPKIDPVFIRIGPLAFRWYGLMYALSFMSAIFLIRRFSLKKGLEITQDQISDLLLYAALGVIFGGRIGYVVAYNPSYFFNNLSKIFAVWEGGMSFHGGMLGAILGGAIYCRKNRFSFYEVADVAMMSVPVGLGLGRIGNFINGELYGRETTVSWCMVFPQGGDVCRHPSQLYQAGLEGLALFLVLWLLSNRNPARGVVFWSLIACYGFFRFIVEFVREPDAHLGLIFGPLSMGQLLSFPMLLIGLMMIWYQQSIANKQTAF
ncbi:MAG: prolipoprotein diacylglyceryl transferase [Nitrospiria bacterium]